MPGSVVGREIWGAYYEGGSMRPYTVSYHRAEDDDGMPGSVGQVLGTYYATSAREALAQAKLRWGTSAEGEYLWARAAA